MNCPFCHTQLPEGAAACPVCGAKPAQSAAGTPSTPQPPVCAVCGRELKAGSAFCAGCGTPVGGQQTPRQSAAPQQPYAPRPPYPPQPYPPRQGQGTVPPAAPYPPRQQAPYGQPQYRQQPYGQWQPQPYMQAQKPKKRKLAVPIIALFLVAAILFTGLVTPGFFVKNRRTEALINRVRVYIPNPTGPEAVVRLTGDIALQYYIEARLYLEKLSEYDVRHIDKEEFAELVLNTIAALENAEKMSACLSEAVDLWMECDDVREAPTYKVLQTAKSGRASGLFAMKAYAAEASRSEIKAKDIIEAFDKAKNGQKINAVAELLGTDAKHAAVQLKMALAGDEKESYDKIAEQATTCIKVAKTLKTAGTVAGVVIAAAPIATGAAAAMATGEMLATGTGVVVSAVNAGLEITSTGAMLYHGTDENEVTQIADAISESKFMQTVNTITSVAGLGYNIKNAFNELEKLSKAGAGAKEIGNFLNTLSDGKTASDIYGILSFGLGNLDSLPGPGGAIASEGVKSLVTMVTHTGEDGLTIDISDTVIGTGKNQIEAVDRLLDELGVTDVGTRGVLDQAVGLFRGEEPDDALPTDPAESVPAELVDQFLAERAFIAPDNDEVDLGATVKMVESVMKTAARTPQLNVGSDDFDDDEPASTPAPTATPKPTATPAPTPTPRVDAGYEKGISGKYTIVIDDGTDLARSEHVADVTLSKTGEMEISYPVTGVISMDLEKGTSETMDGTAWLRGTYDPKTHTFVGKGSTDVPALLVDGSDVTLIFDPDASPVRASGTMYTQGELWGTSYAYTFNVSLVKQK